MAWRPWTEEELEALGKIPDRELARRFGRTLSAIIGKRYILGIPRQIGADENRPWTGAEDRLLGTKLDSVLAKELGRGVAAIRKRRKRKGIPLFRDSEGFEWGRDGEEMAGFQIRVVEICRRAAKDHSAAKPQPNRAKRLECAVCPRCSQM